MNRDAYFCPLIKKKIQYGRCIDINYEIEGFKKEEEIKEIQVLNKITKEKIVEICGNCPNNPL